MYHSFLSLFTRLSNWATLGPLHRVMFELFDSSCVILWQDALITQNNNCYGWKKVKYPCYRNMDTKFQTIQIWYTLNVLVNIFECPLPRSFAKQKNYAFPILDHSPPFSPKIVRIYFCSLRTGHVIFHQKFARKRSG